MTASATALRPVRNPSQRRHRSPLARFARRHERALLGAFSSGSGRTGHGGGTVDRRFLDVARSFGASQRRLFTSVVMPATVPFVVTGLRLGTGGALIGVVVGELYAQTEGLGVLITKASSNLQPDRMFFGILIFTFA